VQSRKIASICALYKAYSEELGWKAIGDSLLRPYYLSSFDHEWKMIKSWQRAEIMKYSFVNKIIHLWNKLPMNVLGYIPSKLRNI